jgi:hypothetical protein
MSIAEMVRASEKIVALEQHLSGFALWHALFLGWIRAGNDEPMWRAAMRRWRDARVA